MNETKNIIKEFDYDWINNKGYGTIRHREMISKYGLCRFHRKTFKIKNKQLKLTI